MRVSRLTETAINEMVDFLLYGDCLEEDTANDYYQYLTEQLCKANSNYSLLQETFVNDGFIKVIDDALQKSKKKNSGEIHVEDVFKEITKAADNFTNGEKTKNGSKKRWLDFDNVDEPFYVKDIDCSKRKDSIKNSKETNKDKFMAWFKQESANIGFKKLAKKYEEETIFIDSNYYTMQNQVNSKFIADCISWYLHCFANNSAEKYKFIPDVDRKPVRH